MSIWTVCTESYTICTLCLDGEFAHQTIRLDPSVDPVQHALRRMQVALRAKLRESLEDLVSQEVLTPVSGPTPWISSIVVVLESPAYT